MNVFLFRPHAGRENGQTPLFVPVGNARGWTLSWWYPCRISCKPEQWSILKGECVPLETSGGTFCGGLGNAVAFVLENRVFSVCYVMSLNFRVPVMKPRIRPKSVILGYTSLRQRHSRLPTTPALSGLSTYLILIRHFFSFPKRIFVHVGVTGVMP